MTSFETYPWEGRAIALVDLDAFFASVEQLDHPEWRGKPVIVGGNAQRHGVVATASYEARAFGVHSAMPASRAELLCPDAIWTGGHFDRYRAMSKQVMDIIRSETPWVEQVSIDEAFCDLSPTRSNTEHPIVVCRRIQKRVDALGLGCSIGLGVSKAVAKTASDYKKPHGITVIYPGNEATFLAPLPTKCMSGIGPVAQEKLAKWNIRTLGEVAQADKLILKDIFGKNSEAIRARCLGADTDEICIDAPVKSVSHELTFAHDLKTQQDCVAALGTCCSQVARRLRLKNLQASCITVKIRYADRIVRTVQKQIPCSINDEFNMLAYAEELFLSVWSKHAPIRLLGVSASKFGEIAAIQEQLFDFESLGEEASTTEAVDNKKNAGLIKASDKIKDKFGEEAVRFGRELRTRRNTTGTAAKNPNDYK